MLSESCKKESLFLFVFVLFHFFWGGGVFDCFVVVDICWYGCILSGSCRNPGTLCVDFDQFHFQALRYFVVLLCVVFIVFSERVILFRLETLLNCVCGVYFSGF